MKKQWAFNRSELSSEMDHWVKTQVDTGHPSAIKYANSVGQAIIHFFDAVESLQTNNKRNAAKQWTFSEQDLSTAIDCWLQEKINNGDASVTSNVNFIRDAIIDFTDSATALQMDSRMDNPKMAREERTAWPKDSIEHYRCIDDGEWGYLVVGDRGIWFDGSARPSDQEILARWAGYFNAPVSRPNQ